MDLGGAAQKLEQSERNQRSWSAPPEGRTFEDHPKRCSIIFHRFYFYIIDQKEAHRISSISLPFLLGHSKKSEYFFAVFAHF